MKKGKLARERILAAAESIIVKKGVQSLTFDEVADQTGLSKGGILHHFSSKDALIRTMVEQFVERFETGLDDLERTDDASGGSYTRAYIRATLGEATSTGAQYDRLGAAITAALHSFPELLMIVREQNMRCQTGVENDGLDPVLATIIRLATEGLWLAEVLDVMRLEPETKRAVVARLMEWTKASASAPRNDNAPR